MAVAGVTVFAFARNGTFFGSVIRFPGGHYVATEVSLFLQGLLFIFLFEEFVATFRLHLSQCKNTRVKIPIFWLILIVF